MTQPFADDLARRPGPYRASLCISAALHAALLLLCAMLSMRLAPQSAPIPVTIRDAAPPPPPGGGQSVAASIPAPQPEPQARPIETKPHPHPRIAKQRPRPRDEAPQPPAAAPLAESSAEPAESAAGVDGGVAGGVAGGQVGGTVGATGDRLVHENELGTPLIVLSRALPHYPALARARGIEGLVVLEAIVDRDGRVEPDKLKVVQSIPQLDDAAIDALKQWRFKPMRDVHGGPMRVVFQVPIRFQLR